MENKTDRMQKVAMLILALYPILSYYPFFTDILSIGNVLIIILLLYCLQSRNVKIRMPKPFLYVWAFVTLASIITASTFKVTLLIPGGVTFCLFAISLSVIVPLFNISYLRRYILVISYIAIAVFLLQELTYYQTGRRFIFLLPLDPSLYGGLTYNELVASHIDSSRSCAFFCETAYYAQYLLLSLCLELFAFTEDKKLFNIRTVLLSVALLLSKSGCGVVGLAVLYFIKFISYNKKLSISTISVSLLFIGVVAYFIGGWITTGTGDFLIERSTEFDSETSSGYIRIMRGYLIFDELPSLNKMIGMPMSEVGMLAESKGLYEQGSGFISNGLQTILLLHGYLGFLLWVIFVITVYKESQLIGRACIFLLLALSLMESVYLSSTMLMLLCAAMVCKNKFLSNNVYA